MFDDKTRVALALADAVCGESHALGADLIEALHAQFNEVELAELALVCAQSNLNNRLGNAARQLLQWNGDARDQGAC